MRLNFCGIALAGALVLASCGGGGGGGGGGPAPPTNQAPTFTSSASVSVAENTSAAFYTATATDPDGNALTFSISGGADAALFRIDANPGALSFLAAPDFEAPRDADRDNVHQITLTVSDGAATATLNVTVTVTNVAGAIRARLIASGFNQPTYLAGLPNGSVLVTQKQGLVRVLDPWSGAVQGTPFLDVSAQVATQMEQGLLSLALAPNYATSGQFYIFMINTAGAIEVRRYATSGGVATASSADVILTIPATSNVHMGGWIGFGPDGYLYITVGDGGFGGDPEGDAQNPSSLFGKVLRIDVNSDAFPSDPNRDYAIPTTNPFAPSGGAPEVWLLGFRNPFRASFDATTGNMYIADVGEGAIEELDLARPTDGGRNYGWNILEGTQPFAGGSTAGLTPPVLEYPHGTGPREGNSIIGGYVYRGPIASLRGTYIFGDYVRKRLFSVAATSLVQGTTLNNSQFTERTADWAPTGPAVIDNMSSFGVDVFGALYILDITSGEVFRLDENE